MRAYHSVGLRANAPSYKLKPAPAEQSMTLSARLNPSAKMNPSATVNLSSRIIKSSATINPSANELEAREDASKRLKHKTLIGSEATKPQPGSQR